MIQDQEEYWLIREKGKEHGFAIVELDQAQTPLCALARYAEWASDEMIGMLLGREFIGCRPASNGARLRKAGYEAVKVVEIVK